MNTSSIADLSAKSSSLREVVATMRHYDTSHITATEITFICIIVSALLVLIACIVTDIYNLRRSSSDPKVIEEIRTAIKLKKIQL